MFNSYSSADNSVKQTFNYDINAVSGTLRKSHPKSKITRVSLGDRLLDKINPMYITSKSVQGEQSGRYYDSTTEHRVVILQVMLCGDGCAVIEFVLDEDFVDEAKIL